MTVVQDAVQAVMKKAIALAPDGWIPCGRPDPLIHHKHGLIGAAVSRIDGPLKVSGKAQFCAEFPMDWLTYAALKYSTIARGRIVDLGIAAAEAAPGRCPRDDSSQRPEAQPRAAIHEQAQGRRSRRPAGDAG
jgi:xanthine dehydrogenase YagR molybdenum-binding subunit